MKTFDEQLKLQAYLDGELSEGEAREIAALIERDAEARELVAELRWASEAIAKNEPQVLVPESREFYWSKIEREIERMDRQPAPATAGWVAVLRRALVPVAGLAALALVVTLNTKSPQATAGTNKEDSVSEFAAGTDTMGAMTFRDHSEGVTMVWLYDRTEEPFTEAMPDEPMDLQ